MFPLFPLKETEALLLSTARFIEIYLDISGGLGTLSTMSEFSSANHSFTGLLAKAVLYCSAQAHFNSK